MRTFDRDSFVYALQPHNATHAELSFSFLGLASDTRLGGAQVEPFLTAVALEAAPSLSFVKTRYTAARPGAAVVMAGEF